VKVTTVVGARPQFVKAAVVSRAFAMEPGVTETIVHTGQHYDENMSEVFFRTLGIPMPSLDLAIGSGAHGDQTGRMLAALERVFQKERPDVVLVYGDTNSTLAAALAAAKLHIPIAHVEAGLRSFNRRMPEEINRILTDHVSELLFAPTAHAVEHLEREGLADRTHFVGDVMYDAALYYARQVGDHSRVLEPFGLAPGEFALATVHRAETTDSPDRLSVVLEALANLAEEMPVFLPLHPRTAAIVARDERMQSALQKLRVSEPIGYLDMIALESNARIIVTDSGGVQKEAYFFKVPCVTMRTETEWNELIDAGWNRLAPPTSSRAIADAIGQAIAQRPSEHGQLFGNGNAAGDIVSILKARFAA
jgi:UDP-GlcNAc3NAcA epimerase